MVAGIAAACVVSVAGYAWLIPQYGAMGAAVAYAVPEFLAQCYYIWLMRRHMLWAQLVPHLVSTGLLLALGVAVALQVECQTAWLQFLLRGGVFVCIFGGGAVALQPRTREFVMVEIRKGAARLRRKE